MLQMFYITVFQETADWSSHTTKTNMQLLADSPIMMHELNELLSFNLERIDFIDQPVPLGFDCPLHWQSQSTTSDTASTGQRYINHRQRGSKVVLFVREFKQDSIGAAPYTCLGTAVYVKHTGSKPMNITWHLDQPIPAKYLRTTNKLVVG